MTDWYKALDSAAQIQIDGEDAGFVAAIGVLRVHLRQLRNRNEPEPDRRTQDVARAAATTAVEYLKIAENGIRHFRTPEARRRRQRKIDEVVDFIARVEEHVRSLPEEVLNDVRRLKSDTEWNRPRAAAAISPMTGPTEEQRRSISVRQLHAGRLPPAGPSAPMSMTRTDEQPIASSSRVPPLSQTRMGAAPGTSYASSAFSTHMEWPGFTPRPHEPPAPAANASYDDSSHFSSPYGPPSIGQRPVWPPSHSPPARASAVAIQGEDQRASDKEVVGRAYWKKRGTLDFRFRDNFDEFRLWSRMCDANPALSRLRTTSELNRVKQMLVQNISNACFQELQATLQGEEPPSRKFIEVIRVEPHHCDSREEAQALRGQYGAVLSQSGGQPTLANGKILGLFAGARLADERDIAAYENCFGREFASKALHDYGAEVARHRNRRELTWAPVGGGNHTQYFNSSFKPVGDELIVDQSRINASLQSVTFSLINKHGQQVTETMFMCVLHRPLGQHEQIRLDYGPNYRIPIQAPPQTPEVRIKREEPDPRIEALAPPSTPPRLQRRPHGTDLPPPSFSSTPDTERPRRKTRRV